MREIVIEICSFVPCWRKFQLIHKYGFYHLEQPEEVETTFAEMLENPLMEKRDEYK